MRNLKKLVLATAVMAIVTLAQHRAEALLIDSFNSNPAPALNIFLTAGDPPAENTQGPGVVGVVGGNRHAKFTLTGGLEGALGTMRVLGTPNGRLSMGSQDESTGTWELDYAPLASIDVTDGDTAYGIAMHFLSADHPATVTATLDIAGPNGPLTQTLPKAVGAGVLLFDFDLFLNSLLAPTTVTSSTAVTGIHFKIQGTPDGDYNIDFIDTAVEMPEPSTWAMFGLGLVGLTGWGWRRRRHRAAA